MVYQYRVTLEGIKGFFRVYRLSGDNTLYTFHKQLRADLEFTVDQPILFKALDASGAVVARYALIDLGFGTIDAICVAKTVAEGVVKFVYFYDVAARKYVNITLEAEEPGTIAAPELVESKGPIPMEFENGYVAFEDLPQQRRPIPGMPSDEDDDDEEDEVNEDKEEEEIVYDGEE